SNFFSRLTHSHPGRVVWLVFNVAIAVLLMELGIDKTIESTLPLYAAVVSAWVGALAADLAVNKPLGFSPLGIEFKRAHLYAVNPVGTGAMVLALAAGGSAYVGWFGSTLQPFAPLLTLVIAFCTAPVIAWATAGRWYLARVPRQDWGAAELVCRVCELPFEGEDMAHCPAYDAPICSLCCSLDARCGDLCKPHGRLEVQAQQTLGHILPRRTAAWIGAPLGRYLAVMLTLCTVIGLILGVVHAGASLAHPDHREVLRAALTSVFFILVVILGIVAWLFVLAQESRRVAQAETRRQTVLYEAEIAAHKVTDAKLQEAKERAEAANQAKSRYVVGLSHELRTPLSSVLGYAQLLETDPTIPAARLNGIRVIRRSAQHLSGLIDGLLDISRMEAGRLLINRDEIRLAEFLDQLTDMIRLQAREAGLDFRFTRPEILPQVVATDEKRLRQVLLNLLSNAIKFTPRGTVSLDLSYRSQVAVFTIRDTGPGIPEADLARIFEPFERGSTPAARSTPGTGLGLTIANLLAQLLGGEITLTPAAGGGTQARLRLMLAAVTQPAHTPAAAPVSRTEPAYAGPRRTVLVVDDDTAHRTLMRAILEPRGLTVREAETGTACLAAVAETKGPDGIDLILLDIAMPGLSGWDVAAALRTRGYTGPIAMMSANVHELGPLRGDSPPHDAILTKPFDLRNVLDRTGALLRLDWTEAPVTASPPKPEDQPALARPGADHVGELLRLGRIGHIRGIEAKLAAMEQDEAVPPTFVVQMRRLIAGYDLRRYLTVLEELAGDE
ncbi:MAG: hybrid sensor histidine kinase/response regulator, partial [Parafilimonas terrae]|nr:hybrid sensor histidine kinase/response regulator [Parafilimonas terrae]